MIGYYDCTHQQHFDSRQAIIDYMLPLLEHTTFAIDVETISLTDRTPVGIAVAVSPREAFYFTLYPEQEELTPWQVLNNATIIFHNSLFDLGVLNTTRGWGVGPKLHDTLAIANLLCLPGKLSDLILVLDTGHEVHEMKEYLKKGMTTLELSTGQLGTKCCLSYRSKVLLADGTRRSIGTIVNNQERHYVQCVLGGELASLPITGWHKKKYDGAWYQLLLKYTPRDGNYYTPDHKILTDSGYKEIAFITTNDRVCTTEYLISDDFLQLILGSCLGDGWIESKNNRSAGICYSHDNKPYAEFKQRICDGSIGFYRERSYQGSSSYLRQIAELRELLYPSGKKTVSRAWLNKLSPLGLAIWYMDDGCLFDRGKTAYLSTEGFSLGEVEVIIDYFIEEFGWTWTKQKTKSGFNLRLSRKDANSFFNIIAPYIIPEMQYKLMPKFRIPYTLLYEAVYQDNLYFVPVDRIEVTNLPKGSRGLNSAYCIDVDYAHNFISPSHIVVHNCQDACATFAAYELLYPQVNKELYEVEIALVPILLEMSGRGIRLDQQRRAELQDKYTADIAFYLQLCQDQELPNPNSPAQVGFILAKRGNLLPMYRKKDKRGKWQQKIKTAKEYLRDLPDPLAQAILAYKHAAKMKSTYLIPLAGMERAYTHWHMDAVTGRVSSTNRNLQNVAYDIRQMFIPDSEVFTAWDASQIEIRCMAYMSQDTEMLRIFESGGDIHQEVADFLHIDRKIAKNTFFSISYGAGDQRAAYTAKIQSLQRIRELKEGLFQKFPGWAKWVEEQKLQAMANGYVYSLYGRKLATTMEGDDPSSVARKGVDFPAQGSAAEIIKRAMIKCKELPMVLQVHDELIADGNVVEEVKALELEGIAPFPIPFNIKTMSRWEE